ncbi:RcnB family protein [Sphingomonas sp.]|uniref:RcnB family protein n=1 Tax=Sphingomonas sp. TaxID=28214 RepID=UPI0035BC17EB
MRTFLIAGTAAFALLGATGASAGQRMVQPGPGVAHAPMHVAPRPGTPFRPMPGPRAPRWGSKVGGHWWGGVNAPGGWNAYRRPVRGWAVPVYWNTPRFYISDWSAYGLAQPQYGYNWVRYYDDAVLIDSRGSVYDTAGDVDWDRYDRDSDAGAGRYADDDRRDDRYDRRDDRRGNGLGGAAIGAVAGGVAGNVIAGRGNRLGGTLIGAGVGAAAGYAIDRKEDRERDYRGPDERGPGAPPPPPPPHHGGYGADYPQPVYGHGYPPPPSPRPYPPVSMAGDGRWMSPDGGTTVVTSGGGYGGSITTVTVQSAPVITTTTTEIYEDHVTWSRPVVRRKVWKPRRKPVCSCR